MSTCSRKSTLNNAHEGKRTNSHHRSAEQTTVNIHSTGTAFIQRWAACPCDGDCPRCAPVMQPKLTIGQPGDAYEQEADRAANEVMRMPEPEVQTKPT